MAAEDGPDPIADFVGPSVNEALEVEISALKRLGWRGEVVASLLRSLVLERVGVGIKVVGGDGYAGFVGAIRASASRLGFGSRFVHIRNMTEKGASVYKKSEISAIYRGK